MNWTLPTKRIYDGADLRYFERSIAFHRLQSVINKIVLLVQNQKVPDGVLNMEIVTRSNRTPTVSMPSLIRNKDQEITWSHNTQTLVDLFNELDKLITDTPPLQGPTRFGNLACRTWHDKVKPEIIPLLEKLEFPASLDINGFLTECSYYLENSFGSKVRLDYGTGHELSFIAFIGSLIEFNVLQDVTGVELLVIFSKYYDLVRRLILFYNLEPAGSHGVWGLDDHFHFIYILGASQFCNDKLAPVVQRALSSQVINSDKATNLYINAIAFIFKLKTGPFNEHSPIIYDIHSKVYSWIKVRQGLMKMYMVEVFGKFPVVQHFWCGEVLYPWKDFNTEKNLPVNPKEEKEETTKSSTTPTTTTTSKPMPMPMTAAPWANNSFTKRR